MDICQTLAWLQGCPWISFCQLLLLECHCRNFATHLWSLEIPVKWWWEGKGSTINPPPLPPHQFIVFGWLISNSERWNERLRPNEDSILRLLFGTLIDFMFCHEIPELNKATAWLHTFDLTIPMSSHTDVIWPWESFWLLMILHKINSKVDKRRRCNNEHRFLAYMYPQKSNG